MISKKLSLNKVCIILATTILLLSVVMFSVLYILTKEMSVVFCSMAFGLLFLLCVTAFVILIRRKLTLFSEMLCCTLDEMMNGKIDVSQVAEEENLFYKINHRLVRLYEVMQESKNSVASERADLQELISDISHQVKTPIANLKMINATLLEQEVPPDKQREFLLASGTQLDKLDFLMQAIGDSISFYRDGELVKTCTILAKACTVGTEDETPTTTTATMHIGGDAPFVYIYHIIRIAKVVEFFQSALNVFGCKHFLPYLSIDFSLFFCHCSKS